MNKEQSDTGTRVVIVGGGVAGLETLLALDDLAGDRVSLTLVAPTAGLLYKPLLVEEPFDLGPAERHELAPLAEEKGARFVQRAVTAVRPEDHVVELDDGSTLEYDYLVVCTGGRFKPALEGATTFPAGEQVLQRRRDPRSSGGQGSPPGVHRPLRRRLVAAALRAGADDSAPRRPAWPGREDRDRHPGVGPSGDLRPGGERGGQRVARCTANRRVRGVAGAGDGRGRNYPDPRGSSARAGGGDRPAGHGGARDRWSARGRTGLHPGRRCTDG